MGESGLADVGTACREEIDLIKLRILLKFGPYVLLLPGNGIAPCSLDVQTSQIIESFRIVLEGVIQKLVKILTDQYGLCQAFSASFQLADEQSLVHR